MLTNYPDHNDVMTLLDGGLLLAYIGAATVILGLAAVGDRGARDPCALGGWSLRRFHHLTQTLIPMAGCGVFLGLSALTVTFLRGDGIVLPYVNGDPRRPARRARACGACGSPGGSPASARAACVGRGHGLHRAPPPTLVGRQLGAPVLDLVARSRAFLNAQSWISAMIGAFVIAFREVIEAGLIISIVLAATRGIPGRDALGPARHRRRAWPAPPSSRCSPRRSPTPSRAAARTS